MSAPDLDAIQARLDAATPGPWVWDEVNDLRCPFDPDYSFGDDGDGWVLTICNGEISSSPADAELIAHAPADLAALLAEVKRLTAEHDEARAALAALRGTDHWSSAIDDVIAKREHQIAKGYTTEHDDEHDLRTLLHWARLDSLRGNPSRNALASAAAVLVAGMEWIDRRAAVLANHPTTKEARDE